MAATILAATEGNPSAARVDNIDVTRAVHLARAVLAEIDKEPAR